MLVCFLEGNVGAGKSTVISSLLSRMPSGSAKAAQEAVADWCAVGAEGHNLLRLYYEEPERHASTFQWYVIGTQLHDYINCQREPGVEHVVFLERSLLSVKAVFVPSLARWLSATEVAALTGSLDMWLRFVFSADPPPAFVYLRASPDLCERRVRIRARPEEKRLNLAAIAGLHDLYERQFLSSVPGHVPLIVLDVSEADNPDELAERILQRLSPLLGFAAPIARSGSLGTS